MQDAEMQSTVVYSRRPDGNKLKRHFFDHHNN